MQSKNLRTACIAAALLLLGYATLLATLSPRGFPADPATHGVWPRLADKPFGEDGFYMLTVADYLATTHRLTYNYGLPVTGIQPLSTFLFAAIAVPVHAAGGDRWTLIRVLILFGAALQLLFAWLLARFAASLAEPTQRPLVFALAFLLLLFDLTLFRLFTYGLETGIYLVLLALCLVLWRRIVVAPREAPHRLRSFVLLGLAAGLAGLARIDFGLLFAFLLLWLLLRRLAALLEILLSGLIALVIVSPWFLFVHRLTGGWMPTSGGVESGLDRLVTWLLALAAHLAPWTYAAAIHPVTSAVAALSVLLLVLLARNAPALRARLASATDPTLRDTFLPWALATGGLTVLYALAFRSTFFYVRYFAPVLLVAVPLLALALAEQHLVRRRPLALFAALLLLFSAEDLATLHRPSFGNPHFLAAGYVLQRFPHVHVGAYQSGVIGYFNPNVENLDGKLNADAHRALLDHTMPALIDAHHIDVLLDWPTYLRDTLPADYLQHTWQPCPIAPPNPQDVCLIRRAFLATHPQYR